MKQRDEPTTGQHLIKTSLWTFNQTHCFSFNTCKLFNVIQAFLLIFCMLCYILLKHSSEIHTIQIYNVNSLVRLLKWFYTERGQIISQDKPVFNFIKEMSENIGFGAQKVDFSPAGIHRFYNLSFLCLAINNYIDYMTRKKK